MLEFLTVYGFKEKFSPTSELYSLCDGGMQIGVAYNAQVTKYRPTLFTVIYGDDATTIRVNLDDIAHIDWLAIHNVVQCETDAEVKVVLVDVIIDNKVDFGVLSRRFTWLRTHDEMLIHSPDYRYNFEKSQFESQVVQYLGAIFKRGTNE